MRIKAYFYNLICMRMLRHKLPNVKCRMIPNLVLSRLPKHVYLGRDVEIYKDSVTIGDYTYMNGGKIFYAKIGKFCSVGYNVVLGGGEHFTDRVTSYPISSRVREVPGMTDFPDQQDCIIDNACWIGNGAIVMQGITVGNGSVIGAGSVVTKDVEPYTIVAGVPARPIRKLFSDDDIAFLNSSMWWDYPIDYIKALDINGAFENIEKFKKYVREPI